MIPPDAPAGDLAAKQKGSAMPETTKLDTEVLVVGAGPVGLTMACELHRHGVPCLVVDRNGGPTPMEESRALGVQARTLEVFRAVGVIDPVLALGRKIHGMGAYADGVRLLHLSFDLDDLDTPYPYIIGLPQSQTERILLDRLAEHGGSVRRGAALEGFAQDEGGVTATLADGSGGRVEVRARWLIGCDGARSVVRKGLGLTFEGGEYEERFLIADLRVGWAMPEDEGVIHLTPEGPLIGLPLPGTHRWRLIDATGMVDSDDPGRIVERFRELVDRYVQPDAAVEDPAWTSAFHLHRRVVDRFRAGRCFVAGDAAHLHSPAGGQGMNTGIQDAFNLAWKLALVVRGRASESLLDSYEAERLPVARAVLKGTDRMTRLVTLRGHVSKEVRNALMAVLAEFDPFRRRVALGVSELAVAYRGSPIVAEDRAGLLHALRPHPGEPGLRDYLDFGSGPRPGDRAPDVPLGAIRLFDVLAEPRHTLLLFEGASTPPGPDADAPLLAAAEVIRAGHADSIRPYLVPHGERPASPSPWPGEVLPDPTGDLHRRYGADAACLYLIRPDGYVGYRAQPPDAEKLRAYLCRVFGG